MAKRANGKGAVYLPSRPRFPTPAPSAGDDGAQR
jgi:hypothetical protein